ncbi:MAG: hypothetical protein L0Z50_31810 [Verrucomicrobiales bacterium]|nr:hypothetical protein [Verrucomicrobiales bacterium]
MPIEKKPAQPNSAPSTTGSSAINSKSGPEEKVELVGEIFGMPRIQRARLVVGRAMATGLYFYNMRDWIPQHFSKSTRAPEKTKVAPFVDHKHLELSLATETAGCCE